jgi:hypothetical protein
MSESSFPGISQPVARNTKAHGSDIRLLKLALGLLGLYRPDPEIGMNDVADAELFDAISALQAALGLEVTGRIKPGDETDEQIRQLVANQMRERYIWRTVRDAHVRPAHAAREGKVFRWSNPPQGGNPGEAPNCRCWAEPLPVVAAKADRKPAQAGAAAAAAGLGSELAVGRLAVPLFGSAAGGALAGAAIALIPKRTGNQVRDLSGERRMVWGPGDLYAREQAYDPDTMSWYDTGTSLIVTDPGESGPDAEGYDPAPPLPPLPGLDRTPSDGQQPEGFDRAPEAAMVVETFPISDQASGQLEIYPSPDPATEHWGMILENRGGPLTRAKNNALVNEVIELLEAKGLGVDHIGGAISNKAGYQKETYYRSPEGSARGSARPDITVEIYDHANEQHRIRLDINTIDTLADGVTPSPREQAAFDRIEANRQQQFVYQQGEGTSTPSGAYTELVPKSGGDTLEDWLEKVGYDYAKRIAENIAQALRTHRP